MAIDLSQLTWPNPSLSKLKVILQAISDAIDSVSAPSLSSLLLTGLDLSITTAIDASTNALAAFGRLQAQVNAKQAALGFTPENAAYRNSPDGYAGLDSAGHVYVSQLPDAILHTLKFKGVFNGSSITSSDAALNGLSAIPAAATGNEGYFIIATGGFTAFGIDCITGDWLISVGTSWQKIDNTDAISSFNGRLGAITLLAADISDLFTALAAKTTLVDGDLLAVLDSGAGNVLKKATLANLYAYLKAKLDAVYQPLLVSGSNLKTVNGNSLLGAGDLVVSGGGGGGAISAIAILTAYHAYLNASQLSFNGNPSLSKTLFNNISGLIYNASGQCSISLPVGIYIIYVVGNLRIAGHDLGVIFWNATGTVILAPPTNSSGGTGGTATSTVGTNYSQYFYLDLSAAGGNTVIYMGGPSGGRLYLDVVAANASTTFLSTIKIEKIA
ncbi:hypothetical protein KFZ76_07310 [Methylovulum psychrotolerans]|uniref:hypothetical protein n=1 Tax=Methylovulum psychrotolerans TaxID=1704499 RepID=UPI001BFF10D9|nr:hypothetical protein [Methylovulum psychrotolerans]MBT9097519.1 hypothetical protein [Methylovulum psychrotolerans]